MWGGINIITYNFLSYSSTTNTIKIWTKLKSSLFNIPIFSSTVFKSLRT